MEQIDPSALVGEMFTRILPESFSSRVPSLPRLNSLRRSLSSSNSHKNAPAPPLPSRRRSTTTTTSTAKAASSKLPERESSVGSASDTLVEDGEMDVVSYATSSASTSGASTARASKSSASTTRASTSSGRSSKSGLDVCAPLSPPLLLPPHQQLGPLLSPPAVEDQHLRLYQGAGKPRTPEDRLGPNFGAHSYHGVDCRWSPSGIKWRYARQGTHHPPCIEIVAFHFFPPRWMLHFPARPPVSDM